MLDDVIEIIRIRGEEVLKKEMTRQEWHNLKKQKGCLYIPYQKGFSQFKETKS